MKKHPNQIIQLQFSLRTIILVICLFLCSNCDCQRIKVDSLFYENLNEILATLDSHFNTTNIRILDKQLQETIQIKRTQSSFFKEVLENVISDKAIDSLINFSGDENFLDFSKINLPISNSILFEKESSTPRVEKENQKAKKIYTKFPIVSISFPYYFLSYSYCVIGINFCSSFSTGDFGYYFFEKKSGLWRLKKVIFRLLK